MQTDICIIGAGPVGIFTIFQAGMLGMKSCVIDALSFPGGQCSALYPEKPIYDIPAYSKITGQNLIENLLTQAKPFNPTFFLNSKAISVNEDKNSGFKVTAKCGDVNKQIYAKVIVIAGGSGFFGPNKPPLDGMEKFENTQVLYFIDKLARFKDKNVVIAGGGDSAVDWAISLVGIAKSVNIVHRRADFRCMPESQKQLEKLSKEGLVRIFTPYKLEKIIDNNNIITGLVVQNIENLKNINIETDYLLPFFGLKTELGEIANWGLKLEKKLIKVDHASMQTSKIGIYAIGDMCSYEGKLKLILSGFYESATAVHNAYNVVFPDKPLHFEHSTSKAGSF